MYNWQVTLFGGGVDLKLQFNTGTEPVKIKVERSKLKICRYWSK